jgi:hypothetical protein
VLLGTAFIDRKFCKDKTIPLYQAPPNQVIVLGNNTQIPASDMATVTVTLGTFRFSVECLVLDKLPDYPLVLGNPWLLKYDAGMSFLRKPVVL